MMALPFLPGNCFNPSLGKTKYHKSHHFDLCNDTSMMVGEAKPGIGGEPLSGQKIKPCNSKFPKGEGGNLPSWIAFDRQVLSFDAYYQEAVVERREEQFRVRKCKIYFYLEDDSIQVIEPRLKNAGVPQGTIVRRQRVPRPPPNDDEFYTVEDFNINTEISIYSKMFRITDCDQFTHNFLSKLGVRVGQMHEIPDDPYTGYRKAIDGSMQPLRPYERRDTLKQFLDYDRRVLRFYVFWDDSDNMFGDKRQMVLHYFLSDDTIEIREIIPPNCGRDAVPVFLRRGRLPKSIESLKLPGVDADRTILNVFGPTGHGGRYILDNLKTGSITTEFYKDSDFTLGAVMNVWGRKMIVCDCDEFTKEYYRLKYGITEFTPVEIKANSGLPIQRQFPPYNGFGSEEDSLCFCMKLLPKPPKRNFIKFMERDRRGLESNILRFLARMDTESLIDRDRRFIISYFLSDDTMLVFEPAVRNSGIIGGKFMERDRVKKPEQALYKAQLSQYYQAVDLYVGATLNLHGHKFVLMDADEYAFRHMEEHGDEFLNSNLSSILAKLRSKLDENVEDVRAFFARRDASGSGVMGYDQFRQLLLEVESSLSEQEIMTVARHFSGQSTNPAMDKQTLVAVAQEQLRRKNYEDFGNVLNSLHYLDKTKSGFVAAGRVRNVFLSQRVPLPDDMLTALLTCLATTNEHGEVDYRQLVHDVNWRDFPSPPTLSQPSHVEHGWNGTKRQNEVSSVKYFDLLEAILRKSVTSD